MYEEQNDVDLKESLNNSKLTQMLLDENASIVNIL